jgi:hypothetical protein
VNSRLAALRKERSHPPKLRSAFGRPEARRAGFDQSCGCVRGSFRLQKSTSGARPSHPQVKNLRTIRRSSFSLLTHRKAKERRKPAQRWLSCEHGGGLSRKESTCRWKTLRTAQIALFDERAKEAVLAFRSMEVTSFYETGWKRQRPIHPASLAVENAAARQHRPVRCSALLQCGVLCVICPKLDRVVKRASTRGQEDRKVFRLALRP